MLPSQRLDGIGEYYFSQKLREIDQLNKGGKDIINLGIGSPDLPPHPEVIKVLQEESVKPNVHGYQNYKGSPVLRKAVSEWYEKWYNVSLDPETEILPLIGSKEGIMHICMTYLNSGDQALVPDPGYPTYRSAVKLAGGDSVPYYLSYENDWLPDFDSLESQVTKSNGKIKLWFVNYPHMPTGKLPVDGLFEKIVAFARKHRLLVVHDNPYSFILNDQPKSILEVPGSKEVVIELNSLSKSHNMAGWRVGVLSSAMQNVNEVLRFKSNMDSGMFLPVQLAAARALKLDESWFTDLNEIYKLRRQKVFRLLDQLECEYDLNQVGLFVWAKVPANKKNGFELSDEILYNSSVFITPGGIFGNGGEAFIRVSLCSTIEKLDAAINRINATRAVLNRS